MTPAPRDAAAESAVPGVSGAAAQAALGALTDVLWREREMLEGLLFKLTAQQMVLRSGESRWLARADAEVRAAVEGLQDFEVLRAAEVDLLVRHYGLPANVSLRELAETAPEPWPTVLFDHREVLRTLTFEIDAVSSHNRRLLQAGERATREALDQIVAEGSRESGGYHFRGDAVRRARSFILDEQA
jgi:FlgN protein